MLLMVLIAPWAAKGQDLADYTFSTGTDENQWITLTDGATTLLANAKDDDASSKTNIGFTFPFGSGSYTQFWVNSNGVFSFSSTTASTGSSGQFSSSYVSTAQPKICGIAKDLTTGSDGYVKSELTGTAPNRVLVCEFFTTHQYVYGYSSTAATCKWQVQLHESDSKVVIVYGATPASSPSGYQIGLGQSSSNFWTVNPSEHTATAQTSAVSTTYSVWPGENRYYAFERPVYTCFKPQNLAATLTPGNGTIATLTWERNAQGTEDAWVLEYGTAANFEGATSVNVTGGTPSKDLTGLTAEQKYYARVKPDCDTDGSKWSDAISFTPTDAYIVTVYDSDGTSTVIPMYGNYFDNYTKSEFIIPATNLTDMQWGTINSITFYAKSIGTNGNPWNTNQKVFIKEVNSTTLGGSFSGTDGATIVFEGSFSMPTSSTDGYTITFSQPYTYSGGNLLIGIYNETKGNYRDVTWYGTTDLTSGVSAYGNNSSSLASVGYTAQSFLPKTTFNYTPGSAPSCLPPTGLAATEDQPNQSVLSWTANNGETSWNIYYKKASAATYTEIADVTDNPYTLPNLDPATQYQYYVVANCTETSDPSAVFPFTTACEIISTYPWNENFDSYAGTTSGSTNNLPLCWNYINTSTDASYKGYPVVYNGSSYSHSGNNHLRFYSYSYIYYGDEYYDPQPQYAVLPEMQSLNTKQIEMYARYYTSGSSFKVGVMSDPADASSFVQIGDPITPTSSYQKYIVSFEGYTGTGTHIAIMMDAGSNGNTKSVCIDNIAVMPLPDCATPTGLAVTANSTTPEGATITWTAGEGTAWTVEYKKSTEEDWTTVTPNVTAPTYTFTGLDANTPYQARVSVICTAGSGVTYPTDPVSFTTDIACPAPKNLVVSDITDTQAVLSWTPGYNETEWTVKYKKQADEEYTTVTPNVTTTPTITLEGLTGATAYDVQIIGCEPTHIYTVSNAFSTAYGLPFMQDFEASTTNLPSGWSKYSGLMSEVLAGTAELTSTTYGWYFSDATPINNYNAYVDIYGSSCKYWLTTPVIMNNNNDNSLSFEMGRRQHTAGTCDDDIFAVLYSINNGATWTILAKWDNAGSERVYNNIPVGSTTDVYLALPNSTKNKGVRFAFYGESQISSNGDYYLCINDVAVDETPSCFVPNGLAVAEANITNESAIATWTAGDADTWNLRYKKTSVELWTTVNELKSATYTMEGLDAATEYEVQVQTDCGSNGTSDWTASVSFTTNLCADADMCEITYSLTDQYDDSWNGASINVIDVETEKKLTTITMPNVTGPYEGSFLVCDGREIRFEWIIGSYPAECGFVISDASGADILNVAIGDAPTTNGVLTTYTVDCPSCIKPSNLQATAITTNSATLSWTGSSDSYVLQYRPWYAAGDDVLPTGTLETYTFDLSAYTGNGSIAIRHYDVSNMFRLNIDDIVVKDNKDVVVYSQDFESCGGSMPTEFTMMDLDGDGNNWYVVNFGKINGSYGLSSASWTSTDGALFPDNWLILSGIQLGGSISFQACGQDASFPAENFCVYVCPDSEIVTVPLTATTYPATGLVPHSVYAWQVKGICGDEETSFASSLFQTLDDILIFATEGNWNDLSKWTDVNGAAIAALPTINDKVRIDENVIITSSTVAYAKKASLNGGTITIADGGQLKLDATVEVTMEKDITGYGSGTANWYFIASPLTTTRLTYVDGWSYVNALTGSYDLYAFDPTAAKEWINYKSSSSNAAFTSGENNPVLLSQKGYLYAHEDDFTLEFTGSTAIKSHSNTVTEAFTYDGSLTNPFNGFALVGNPFSCNGYLTFTPDGGQTPTKVDFYTMNTNGDGFDLSETNVALTPLQGAFFYADATGTINFSSEVPTSKALAGALNIYLAQDGKQADQARIRFGEGMRLAKATFRDNTSKIYMPQEDKDYAVVYTNESCEMPLNFKAETAGQYSISFKLDGANVGYLHLYDKITGEDVNLFTTPEYSFIGSPRDMEDRFIIRFSESSFNETFAYQNGDEIIVNGEGTLQVFDVMGRFMGNYNVNGNTRISASQFSNAVYIFRLVGDDVKTQKIVVR